MVMEMDNYKRIEIKINVSENDAVSHVIETIVVTLAVIY